MMRPLILVLAITSNHNELRGMKKATHHLLSPAMLVVLGSVGWLALGSAQAADKTYEKPSAFLKRHFGSMPKTKVLSLTGGQQKKLSAILGHRYGQQKIRYWSESGKTAWILNEIGKTEPITTGFVVRAGKLVDVKVLIYRESHGWEVSRPFFTKQFVGATLNGKRLSQRVDGVVGATLSVRAITKLSAAALYLTGQTSK